MSLSLSKQYVAAFGARDLAAVGALLADQVSLEDPVVKRIDGKPAVLQMMAALFASCQTLAFTARQIYVDGDSSIIEFVLELDATRLQGADIIEWRDGKMHALRAYLDIPKG